MFKNDSSPFKKDKIFSRALKIGIVLLAFLIVSVTAAWMFPGFVESPGFLESDSRVALYAPVSGVVESDKLRDGLHLNKGDVILVINQDWPLWNLKRLKQEITDNQVNFDNQKRVLRYFLDQRRVEEAELMRLLNIERRLLNFKSVPVVNVQRRHYSYESFFTLAEREKAELELKISEIYQEGLSLRTEKKLWEQRLLKYELPLSVSGTFYMYQTLLPDPRNELLPKIGPGYYVKEGDFLGYVIPDDSLKVVIRIPQARVARVKVGQHVLISMMALPAWRFRPIKGKLVSINTVASGGYFKGKVEISSSERTNEEIKNLYFGDLIARISVKHPSSQGWMHYLWERWAVLVNSVGEH